MLENTEVALAAVKLVMTVVTATSLTPTAIRTFPMLVELVGDNSVPSDSQEGRIRLYTVRDGLSSSTKMSKLNAPDPGTDIPKTCPGLKQMFCFSREMVVLCRLAQGTNASCSVTLSEKLL